MMKKSILATMILSVLFITCQKSEGEGGRASIRGKVTVRNYDNSFKELLGTFDGADRDVYIIYGDDVTYSDRQRTNYDGSFEFKYLRTGWYRLFTYSDDSTLQDPSGSVAVIDSVEIVDKKGVYQLNTFYVLD